MIKIIEIITPNCSKCKDIKPLYEVIQDRIHEQYPNKVEFITYVFPTDNEAKTIVSEFNIKIAPSFILDYNNDMSLISLNEIEKTLLLML